MHLVDPAGHKLSQAHKGVRAGSRGVRVVSGGRIGAPILKQVLSGRGLEPLLEGDDRRAGGEVLCKVEGEREESDHVRDEGRCHEGQGRECVISLSRVLVLVRRTVPREVEEEVRLVINLLLGKTRSPK